MTVAGPEFRHLNDIVTVGRRLRLSEMQGWGDLASFVKTIVALDATNTSLTLAAHVLSSVRCSCACVRWLIKPFVDSEMCAPMLRNAVSFLPQFRCAVFMHT